MVCVFCRCLWSNNQFLRLRPGGASAGRSVELQLLAADQLAPVLAVALHHLRELRARHAAGPAAEPRPDPVDFGGEAPEPLPSHAEPPAPTEDGEEPR